MNPIEPENLPPKDLDLLALMPLIGKANRAIATLEGLFYGIPKLEQETEGLLTEITQGATA